MAKSLRYALATFCFAASVGCLPIRWWSNSNVVTVVFPLPTLPLRVCAVETYRGSTAIYTTPGSCGLRFISTPLDPKSLDGGSDAYLEEHGIFGQTPMGYYFPLWYPALIFTLAGVTALRLGRRFTLRSAIIATTVAAGLLGMAVTL